MVINYIGNGFDNRDLFSFLRENEFTGLRLKLLIFWGKHPQAKFNLNCIAHCLDINCQHLRYLLKELIDKGMINEDYSPSGMAHYSLNPEHAVSGLIQDLANMDWSLIKNLEGAIEREAVPA